MPTVQTQRVILRNSARCLQCGDEIVSLHVHDFKRCTCGNIFVDGGPEYLRRGAKNLRQFQDTSTWEDDTQE